MSCKLNTAFYHGRGELELYYSNIPVFVNTGGLVDYATTEKIKTTILFFTL